MAAGARNRQPQRERTWNFPCFFHVLCCCTHRFDKFELLSAAAKRGRLNLPSCQTAAGTRAATRNRHTTACALPAIFVRHESQNGAGRTLLAPADHRSLGVRCRQTRASPSARMADQQGRVFAICSPPGRGAPA